MPLPAIERAVQSGPQLRRADLSVEPISYEVEPSEETACAEVDGMPSDTIETLQTDEQETMRFRTAQIEDRSGFDWLIVR